MQIIKKATVSGECFPDGLQRIDYRTDVDDWATAYGQNTGEIGIVVLHGHGSHGDQLFIRADIRPRIDFMLKQGLGFLTPNLRDNAWMCPEAASDLAGLIRWAKAEFNWRKIILASGSMGGSGNLIFAMLHPELVDAVVALGAATDLRRYADWCAEQTKPICGEIRRAILTAYRQDNALLERHSVYRHAQRLTMPVWLRHGSDDAIIPVSEARALTQLIPLNYQEIPGGDHDSPLHCWDECVDEALNSIS